MLDIRLLGAPRVFRNGELIRIKRKTTRALLFYLAMHPKGVRRSFLAEAFAGEGDETKKRPRLRNYLSYIRKIDKDSPFLIAYHDAVRLDSALVRVDALELSDLVGVILRSKGNYYDQGATIPLTLYQRVAQVADEFDCPRFVANNDFDISAELSQWHTETEAALHKDQEAIFAFLAEIDDRLGRTGQAIEWAERALNYGKSETAYYVLIKNLRDLGNFGEAQQRYQEAEEILWEGLSARILALGKEIVEIAEPNPLYVRPALSLRPSASLPFVGQEDRLQRMMINYQRGIGSLLVGEAGAGKTRLAQQFHQNIPMPPNLLLVPCYKDNENLPYQPWIDMLRHTFTPAFWQDTPAWWTTPLTMLLPELHEYRDDLDAAPGDVFVSALVFEAMKNLLRHANKQGAVLVFVEDSQWMDRVSFMLLKYLIVESTFKQWNIGLVITSRLGIRSGVDRFELDAMQGRLDEIKLSGLGDDEIQQFAFHLLKDLLPEQRTERLAKLTGGNPFFLLEILSFQASHPEVDIFEDFVAAPPSLRQLIAARLDMLSPQARAVLNYAAIQGNHFIISTLEKVLAMSSEKMLAAISELTALNLINFVKKDIELHYAFVHEKLREEIISALSPIELRVMHAKVANLLAEKQAYQDEQAAVLAEHYENAGEFEKAFSSWYAAAQYAYDIFSPKDAHKAYLRAEKLLAYINLLEETIYDFYFHWNVMLFNTDNPDMLEAVMQNLLLSAQRRGSNLLIGAALDGLSDVCMARNHYQEGLVYVEQALPYLIMAAHIPAQMIAFIHQGVFLYMLKNFPDSLESFQTVVSLYDGQRDPDSMYLLGNVYYQMAASLTGMGYPLQAIEKAKQSIHYMRLSCAPHNIVAPESMMGLANYYVGEYTAGKKHALNSLALSNRTGTWRMSGYAAAYLGMNEVELPELDNAYHHAHEAMRYGEKRGHTEIVAMGYKIIGDIYARLEAPVKAADAYQRGLAVDKNSFAAVENATRLGVTLGLVGDPKADALLEEALRNARQAGLEIIEFNARALQLSLFVARQEYVRFDENLSNIRTMLTERSNPKSYVWIDYLQALRLYQEGKLNEALTLIEQSLPVLDASEFFWIKLRAQRLHLKLLQASEKDTSRTQARIREMLATIEAGLGNAPLEAEWQVFSQRVLS